LAPPLAPGEAQAARQSLVARTLDIFFQSVAAATLELSPEQQCHSSNSDVGAEKQWENRKFEVALGVQ